MMNTFTSPLLKDLLSVSPDALPFTYCLDGKPMRGFDTSFTVTKKETHPDARVTSTVIEGKRDGLCIRLEASSYDDAPALEYTVYFENQGTTPTGIFSNILALDQNFVGAGEATLEHLSGDTRGGDGYHTFFDRIGEEGFTLTPADDGCSCNGAFPYTRVYFADKILTAVYGWTGGWKAIYTKTEGGVSIAAGQKYCHFRILPGETMRTPRICLMETAGCEKVAAINDWRHFYFAHVMPKQWGENIPPKACMHVHGAKLNGHPMPEFFGATEDNQIYGLNWYIKRGLKPDLWWFDAGMHPIHCAPWPACGNQFCDPARFPNQTMEQIGRECEKHGVDFMLWFEPERSTIGSEIEREHPEFLLHAKTPNSVEGFNALVNLGDPKALEWLTDRIDTLIKKYHVHIYRQDFNFDPFTCFRDNETEDRLGALENLHYQGYYKFWDELMLRNPGLFIDTCASGGRRNDYETLRRAVPFQYTDVGTGCHPIKQIQHQVMFEWIPYFRAHTHADDNHNIVDEFAFFNAFAPAVTYSVPVWCEDEAQLECGRKMLPIWRRAAEIELHGDFYPQMVSTQSHTDFFCIHFFDPKKEEGFVLFIRNRDCEEASFTATLALTEGDYTVEDPVSGETYEASSASLKTVKATLEKRAGKLLFFTKKK